MWWVNVNFQAQSDNRDAKHFLYNFLIKNTRDVLNFTMKLIDDNNKDTEFEDGEKKFAILYFLIKFIALIIHLKKKKKKDQGTTHRGRFCRA